MRLGRRRQGEDEVWMVVVVVVVVVVRAENAGTPEACRTLPGASLVPATFLLFDLSSGTSFSSCSSVEGLRLLLRLVCDGLSLLLAIVMRREAPRSPRRRLTIPSANEGCGQAFMARQEAGPQGGNHHATDTFWNRNLSIRPPVAGLSSSLPH